jgi:NADPH-dependent 2,4-dienoyl-CoA reductase/sulfur reductase-like enzyme
MPPAQTIQGTHLKGTPVPLTDTKAKLNKYEEERLKRIRTDGLDQFITSPESQEYSGFYRDPWVNDNAVDPGANSITDGSRCEFLILGAGYGGLLIAARLIQAGIDVNGIRLVDTAGGYGGTWWYNRYASPISRFPDKIC